MDELDYQAARLLDALGRGIRVEILMTLAEGELCVRDVMERLGRSNTVVSHHLATLRANDVVRFRVEGRRVFYSLKDRSVMRILEQARRYAARAAGRTERS